MRKVVIGVLVVWLLAIGIFTITLSAVFLQNVLTIQPVQEKVEPAFVATVSVPITQPETTITQPRKPRYSGLATIEPFDPKQHETDGVTVNFGHYSLTRDTNPRV